MTGSEEGNGSEGNVSEEGNVSKEGNGSEELGRFVALALRCVHREYPNQPALRLECDGDLKPPRQLTPAFYGCYDWHSAVHGHWTLVRAARWGVLEQACRERLAVSFHPDRLAAEAAHLRAHPAFERPYGLAWLLQLHAELAEWDDADARRWAARVEPVALVAATHLSEWLPKLTHPVRSGTHSQTAFALGLALDWARGVGRSSLVALLEARARDFFGRDRDYPVHLEPSGEDFLSPSLGAADLMRRVLSPPELSSWLDRTLPIPAGGDSFPVPCVSDRADGRLAHLDGLTLSRAWMLDGLLSALPADDPRRGELRRVRDRHIERGLAAVDGAHYAGAHWLGTFALYLLTRRGV